MQKRQNAEKRLELKEESEKATVFRVKENRCLKRFDLLSGLAGAGTVAVLLFECIFVFELYARDFKFLERLFPAPAAVKIAASAGKPAESEVEPSAPPESALPLDKAAKDAVDPEAVELSPAPEVPVAPDLLNSARPVG